MWARIPLRHTSHTVTHPHAHRGVIMGINLSDAEATYKRRVLLIHNFSGEKTLQRHRSARTGPESNFPGTKARTGVSSAGGGGRKKQLIYLFCAAISKPGLKKAILAEESVLGPSGAQPDNFYCHFSKNQSLNVFRKTTQ